MTNGELHELFAGIEDVALFRDLEFGAVFGASRRMLAHLDQWVESYHAEIAAADPGRATQLVDDSAKAFARVIRAWAAERSVTGEG